jgi:hypothetical protein
MGTFEILFFERAVSDESSVYIEEHGRSMLDVHSPHESVHTWKSFFIHIAIITIGLLIAICLEKTVEYFHHRHQARDGLASLLREVNENQNALRQNAKINEWAERQHRAEFSVPRRLQAGTVKPGDHLIFIRPYVFLADSAWKIVHESDAAPYIPYDLLALYGTLYDTQEYVNKEANAASYDLQRATAALNTEQENMSRDEENGLQAAIEDQDISSITGESYDAMMSRLSGTQDLSQLTPAQIDRLEQGFQQAITDDRRLNRFYLALGGSYDDVIAKSK